MKGTIPSSSQVAATQQPDPELDDSGPFLVDDDSIPVTTTTAAANAASTGEKSRYQKSGTAIKPGAVAVKPTLKGSQLGGSGPMVIDDDDNDDDDINNASGPFLIDEDDAGGTSHQKNKGGGAGAGAGGEKSKYKAATTITKPGAYAAQPTLESAEMGSSGPLAIDDDDDENIGSGGGGGAGKTKAISTPDKASMKISRYTTTTTTTTATTEEKDLETGGGSGSARAGEAINPRHRARLYPAEEEEDEYLEDDVDEAPGAVAVRMTGQEARRMKGNLTGDSRAPSYVSAISENDDYGSNDFNEEKRSNSNSFAPPGHGAVVFEAHTVEATTDAVVTKVVSEDEDEEFTRPKWLIPLGIGLLVVAAAVAIPLALSSSSSSSETIPTTLPPSKTSNLNELIDAFESVSERALLEDGTSPQYMAVQWLDEQDELQLDIESPPSSALLERYLALVFFYSTNIGQDQTDLILDYRSTADSVCAWQSEDGLGITCDSNGLIANITINQVAVASQLRGTIPSEIFRLPALHTMDLGANALSNTLPTEIGQASNLKSFAIRRNQVEGEIPSSIGGLEELTYLDLGENRFTGQIPVFGGLGKLTHLDLGGNRLSGVIPSSLADLSNLKFFEARRSPGSGPSLTGGVPSEVGLLLDLEHFRVDNNQGMDGPIPSELGRLQNLQVLGLSGSGSIPTEFGLLGSLSDLYLAQSAFTGSIPTEVGLLQNLALFDMKQNLDITGSIPTEMTLLDNLANLRLSFTSISGSLDTRIGLLQSLARLDIRGTLIEGSIPTEIGLLTNLRTLGLSETFLSGEVPTELANLSNLEYLYLESRLFSGSVEGLCENTSGQMENFFTTCDVVFCPCCATCGS